MGSSPHCVRPCLEVGILRDAPGFAFRQLTPRSRSGSSLVAISTALTLSRCATKHMHNPTKKLGIVRSAVA
jgi:hypothetical protein